jgi:predicted nucleic acid-binding protein
MSAMPAVRLFLDANFLVYQRDASDPQKHATARDWTQDLLRTATPTFTGWQAIREYYSAATRKGLVSRAEARIDVAYWAPLVPAGDRDDLEQAWRLEDACGFNFCDCLILASALNAGATHLLTEDMQHDQVVDGLRIVNPFAARLHELGVT